ncbi:MAG: NAD(P)/FAD-dependent oxidoreductase, partial [Bacteroidales bacterium]|nr:NAD(P)/FAD-dependent oxidoreductase [Bacteroidales bacterium]
MKYHTIIIGAGLGGLTAGAKLAKEGKKVLLIEQHMVPGGCATTFKRKDYTLEVGLHEMDGLHEKDMKTKIFRDLGVFDKVEFLKVPEFYRFVNERYDIVIPHDPDEAIKILINHFPDEEKGIKAYFHQVMNARQIIKESAGEKERTVGEFLDSIIENNNLKLVLLGNLGYFHDDPYSLSLSYYSVAQGSYYTGGGNFIKRGSQELSNHLATFIEDNGGKVILNNLVTDIITDNNKAIGVIYRKKQKKPEKAFAGNIIANAAIPNVANLLLPWKHGKKLRQQFRNMEPGASLLTVYFGFKKSLKEIGNKYYST